MALLKSTAVSMYRGLAPRILVPLYERLSGRRPWTELRRLRELQWRTPEELEARALEKLRPLLAHAYAHVPYYHDLFARSGVRQDDIRTLADLSEVPMSGKAELRANFPDGVVADNLPARRRYKSATSGSTGLPFEFYTDRASADTALGSYLLFREWAGVAVGDTMVYITTGVHASAGTAGSSRFTRALRQIVLGERVVLLSGMALSAGELRARLGRLPPGTRYVIWGWPSSTARIAVELLEQGA